ncbi:MAG TPA: hydroxyacylglutathione hydrolase [Stellaceae bacterium]|nr:hydroxyacylglutathione hydrolase [Stellaceae bacterium]
MSQLDIRQIPVLKDNYVYLLHDEASGATAVVDPAVPEPVLAALSAARLTLTHILNTHHHADHVGGNEALKAATGCIIVGPRADRERIPLIDIELGEGDSFTLGTHTARIFDVPGHTRGHIAYWFKEDAALFCGDTLFIMGCGRLFEGTPEQMWRSLNKLRSLPPATRIFCAHEYTESNARFALTVDPGNEALIERMARVKEARAMDRPTVPGTLGEELLTNPFLRADQPALQAMAGAVGDPIATFAEIRRRKDRF